MSNLAWEAFLMQKGEVQDCAVAAGKPKISLPDREVGRPS